MRFNPNLHTIQIKKYRVFGLSGPHCSSLHKSLCMAAGSAWIATILIFLIQTPHILFQCTAVHTTFFSLSISHPTVILNSASIKSIKIFKYIFDIRTSVQHKYISEWQLARCNVSWFIYFYRRSTCFRRFLRPSSGAHNCTYSCRYCQPILLFAAIVDEISSIIAASSSTGWQYLKLYVQLCAPSDQLCAPDDRRRNRLKHVEHLSK